MTPLISLLLVLVLVLPGAARAQQPGTRQAFPSFGLSVEAPAGWRRVPELSFSQVGRWTGPGDGARPALVVELERVPANRRSAEDVARALAAERGGTPGPYDAPLAGQPAWVVRFDAPAGQMAARRAIVSRHGEELLLVGHVSTDGGQTRDEVDRFVRSIRVAEPEPPADDLSLSDRPIPLFDTGHVLQLPEPMRPDRVGDPRAEAFYGAQNYADGGSELGLQVQLRPKEPTVAIGQVATSMQGQIAALLSPERAVAVTKVRDDPDVYLSDVFEVERDGAMTRQAMAVFAPSPDWLVFMNFSTRGLDADTAAAYAKAIEEIARSVRPAPQGPATRPAQQQ